MTYIEGFLTPVPAANREAYLAHAERALPLLKEFGVTRMVEAWGDDVPRGKTNDLWGAVAATGDEAVVFSWFEYPDRAVRDAASARMMADPRMAEMFGDMPFDASRMIWGGFDPVHDSGSTGAPGYIDGVVLPVEAGGRDAYARHAAAMAPLFVEHGALRVMDAITDDLSPGEVVDFPRAVLQADGETVAYGWIEWPDRATRDAGWQALMADPRMAAAGTPPYDGKRMAFGGFAVILDR
jgi:uncharacterized protein YbaA (DUF1428 family)